MYQYLKKLSVDIDSLRSQVASVPEEKWEYWINPGGKIVRNYKQIYSTQVNLEVDSILSQITSEILVETIAVLRYDVNSILKPHTDWSNKSAILIGISKDSDIHFWRGNDRITVPYIYPVLANLEEVHSVKNSSRDFRYVLKIPFRKSYQDTLEELSYLL